MELPIGVVVMTHTTYNFYKLCFFLGWISLGAGIGRALESQSYPVAFMLLGIVLIQLTKGVINGTKVHARRK